MNPKKSRRPRRELIEIDVDAPEPEIRGLARVLVIINTAPAVSQYAARHRARAARAGHKGLERFWSIVQAEAERMARIPTS